MGEAVNMGGDTPQRPIPSLQLDPGDHAFCGELHALWRRYFGLQATGRWAWASCGLGAFYGIGLIAWGRAWADGEWQQPVHPLEPWSVLLALVGLTVGSSAGTAYAGWLWTTSARRSTTWTFRVLWRMEASVILAGIWTIAGLVLTGLVVRLAWRLGIPGAEGWSGALRHAIQVIDPAFARHLVSWLLVWEMLVSLRIGHALYADRNGERHGLP
ncbi:MAG: hypothetical protein AB1411_16505 [Nitrospirota bacterium]